MANQEKYAQQMQDAGVCDARGAALCATVKELPDGSFGMVLLGVKGNDLLIYDTNMKSEPLKLMRTIPLKGVTDFSTTSLMGEILKGYTFRFTSDGFTYSFKNCRRQAFLDVLQQEINTIQSGGYSCDQLCCERYRALAKQRNNLRSTVEHKGRCCWFGQR